MADFHTSIKNFGNMTDKKVDLLIRSVALDLHSGIVETAPVDTGRLKGSVLLSIDEIDTYIPSEDEVDKSGLKTIAKAKAKLIHPINGKTIYIQTNLDYAYEIEFLGKSKRKAPDGFFGINILRFDHILKSNLRRNAMGTGFYLDNK